MPEAVIKIGDKKPPEPGKKRWKIIGFNNEVFQLNADFAPLFIPGKSYKVFYEDQEFQERKFRVIVKAPEEVPDISTGVHTFGASRATLSDAPSMPTQPDRSEIIWCCAVLKEEIRAGRISGNDGLACASIVETQQEVYRRCFLGIEPQVHNPPKEEFPKGTLKAATDRARAAFMHAHKVGQGASVDSEMDDDIPY